MLIRHARGVHSIGMRFSMDVAFLDADLVVLDCLMVRPFRATLPRRRPLGARGRGGCFRTLGPQGRRSAGDQGVTAGLGAGELVLVATPIGNLGDLSPRAASTLATADIVCCEDTRHTGTMLTAPRDKGPAARLLARRQRGRRGLADSRRADRRTHCRRSERRRDAGHSRSGRAARPRRGRRRRACDRRAGPFGGADRRRVVGSRRNRVALRGVDCQEGEGEDGTVGGHRRLSLPERLLRVAAAVRGHPRGALQVVRCRAPGGRLPGADQVARGGSRAPPPARRRCTSAPSHQEANSRSSSTARRPASASAPDTADLRSR